MSFYLQNLASRQPLSPAWVERPRRNFAGHEGALQRAAQDPRADPLAVLPGGLRMGHINQN